MSEQAAVAAAVGRELGVAMELAAPDAQRLVAQLHAIVAHPLDVLALGRDVVGAGPTAVRQAIGLSGDCAAAAA